MQNPGDYALRDRIGDELPQAALETAGLGALAERNPRDLSGGERQRLALAIVLRGERPAVVCLDEPTRGMDRRHKETLCAMLQDLAAAGSAVIVATHDTEFTAAFSERTVLLGDGRPVADAPTADVLAGGWYFATQTARILDGAALLPEEGAALLRREVALA
jgi:energy-coupling factor transport system ATP-binding protein